MAPDYPQRGCCYMRIDDRRCTARSVPKLARFDGARAGEFVVVGDAKQSVGVGRAGCCGVVTSLDDARGQQDRPAVAAAASSATSSGLDSCLPQSWPSASLSSTKCAGSPWWVGLRRDISGGGSADREVPHSGRQQSLRVDVAAEHVRHRVQSGGQIGTTGDGQFPGCGEEQRDLGDRRTVVWSPGLVVVQGGPQRQPAQLRQLRHDHSSRPAEA
ncbi:MAG: hypothetical protein LC799_07220 [Actinobacteria bacterium]|nr:hypothetical protein [Actinomycetota bacterium]